MRAGVIREVLAAALLLAGLAPAVRAQGPVPAAPGTYAAFPCLSYTLPCGKAATRKPVQKRLEGPLNGVAERGRQIAQARNRGNCLACHAVQGGQQAGTRGPDLRQFGRTGRSEADTYAMVYDMRTVNPDTLMPPFGTNEVLTEPELRDVVAFLLSSR